MYKEFNGDVNFDHDPKVKVKSNIINLKLTVAAGQVSAVDSTPICI